MSARKKTSAVPNNPQVVGTIHSQGSLDHALTLGRGEVDVLELRVDHFVRNPETLKKAAAKLQAPLIVTVRHPKEGGAQPLTTAQRAELYREFMDVAQYIDVEVRSLQLLPSVIDEAKRRGVLVIVSDHHFRSTPSPGVLAKRFAIARQVSPDLVKVAATANRPADLVTLLNFLSGNVARQGMSVMGMGSFGKISRLLFAQAGSLLNYGYLDKAQVPGQWEATLLKKRVAELTAS